MIGVLFVCTGNICRSPTAEGVFRRRVDEAGLAARFRIDSAGISAYHTGEPPDARSVDSAARIRLFIPSTDVPDPWYGGPRDFETVFDMVAAGAVKLLDDIRREQGI